mgnify:CR=1 FL=1
MRKLLLMTLIVMLLLAGCSSNSSASDGAAQSQKPADESKSQVAIDLTGEWEQSDKNSEDSYQIATITEGTIEVYWVSDGGDTTSLYWAGTYEAPEAGVDSYSWDSVNDTEKTGMALMASGDETKTFTYENEQISYSVTALGVTTTVRLERVQ